MNHLEIQTYITRLDWLHDPQVTYLASGYGNDNYRIDDGDSLYVCRVKNTVEFPHSLFHEYCLYTFLETEGHHFTPRAHHITDDGTILIISYLSGTEKKHIELTDAQIHTFTSQLHTLNTLPMTHYSSSAHS